MANAHESNTGVPSSSAHSTSPGKITFTVGGVGRNIAEAAHRILAAGSGSSRTDDTVLVSPLVNDAFADKLMSGHQQLRMRTDGFIRIRDSRTAACSMVIDSNGSLVGGVADMDIASDLTGEQVRAPVCLSLQDPSRH